MLFLSGCDDRRPQPANTKDPQVNIVTKPIQKAHVNVGVIGNSGDGPIRLAIALAGVGGTAVDEQPLQKGVDRYTFLEYESRTRHYAHIVFPRQTTLDNIYRHLAGLDGCVLYLDEEGITQTTRAHLLMAAAAGVSKVIVFVDGGSTVSEDTQQELTSLLRDAKVNSTLAPILFGSTKRNQDSVSGDTGAVTKLLSVMDRDFEPRPTDDSAPFLMPIDDVFSIAGRGVVVTGRVERGIVQKGEDLELVGQSRITAARCVGIETFRQDLDLAHGGDNVGILIDHSDKSKAARGMLLVKSNSLQLSDRFEADVYLENTTSPPSQVDFLFRTVVMSGEFSTNGNAVAANNWSSVTARIAEPYGLEAGMMFVISIDGEFAGIGKVTKTGQPSP